MDVLDTIVSSVGGIIIGLLMIKYADAVAAFIGDMVGNSIIRDTNNPWTYRILGALLIGYSVVMLFL